MTGLVAAPRCRGGDRRLRYRPRLALVGPLPPGGGTPYNHSSLLTGVLPSPNAQPVEKSALPLPFQRRSETSMSDAATPAAPWLVVGLGNPGPEYAGHRHNVGFMVVEVLAARAGARFKAHRSGAEVVEGRLAGHRAILAKPRSFMNLSGGPTKALADFYKVPVAQVLVVHDELDLPFATLRLKLGGGDNGHNGLKSLTRSLGSRDYHRARFGIGRPPGRMDPAAFVLRDFSSTERKELPVLVEQTADAVETVVAHGLERAQNTFHALS